MTNVAVLTNAKLNTVILNSLNLADKSCGRGRLGRTRVLRNNSSAAQNGIPNKTRLCAANGLSPAVMLGNSLVENDILADVFDGFKPLKTSYTQGAENDEGGRPEMDEADLSSSGERTKENDTNDRDNRI